MTSLSGGSFSFCMCLLELAPERGGSFLSLGLSPFFWAAMQQLFIETKCIDPTYLYPGDRGEDYCWISVCLFSELLHQNSVPIDEEKLGRGPFGIRYIHVTFFGNGIVRTHKSSVFEKKKKKKSDTGEETN